ncbi:hypothetical protein WME75_01230 [Sorangium sp. So ce1014]|uniref:hypothetical protein n=1 Tax=Sorangium sp. So ce1014 TaxID=3133326 RepID=UPI003F64153E
MKRFIMALGMLAIASAGCDEIVFVPEVDWTDPPDPGPAPDPPPPPEEGDPPVPGAVAMRAGDVPPDFGFGTWEDPETTLLIFDSDAQECIPTLIEARCDNAPIWQLILIIPSEIDMDMPGLIDLTDPRIGFRETLSENHSGCSFGRGAGFAGYHAGTLEIVSSDEASLFVKLRGAGMRDQVNGDYTVERCGAAAASGE